jgi:hypothetical protein
MLELVKLIRETQRALSLAIRPCGFNVGLNFGRCAGAGLPGHMHIHVVPRWDGDTNFMGVCSDTRVISQSMIDLLAELRQVSAEHGLPFCCRGADGEPMGLVGRMGLCRFAGEMSMSDGLRSYAATEAASRGRAFPESPHPYRSDFERDRDRIIHSSAFRRLEGKTQVFSPGLDDYYRSRLTHSIEVAQIGRTIAKVLGLNEHLTEAICLAHDLGHPPFGHTGEETLNELMADHGGFEHNAQTLRIVTLLEHPYPAFMGLNLMYETRLGLAKKCVGALKRRTCRCRLAQRVPTLPRFHALTKPTVRWKARSPTWPTGSRTIATTWRTGCGPG